MSYSYEYLGHKYDNRAVFGTIQFSGAKVGAITVYVSTSNPRYSSNLPPEELKARLERLWSSDWIVLTVFTIFFGGLGLREVLRRADSD